jgi:signal transduction histidine kinase
VSDTASDFAGSVFILRNTLSGICAEIFERQLTAFFTALSNAARLTSALRTPFTQQQFEEFHGEIFNAKLRTEFGFDRAVVVYLYRSATIQEFGSVYIDPKAWAADPDGQFFMEQAILELRQHFFGGPHLPPARSHLFLGILERATRGSSETLFVEPIGEGAVDAVGRRLGLANESERLFRGEALLVTPLRHVTGVDLVTVNTFVRMPEPLGTLAAATQDALRAWYIGVHEAMSSPFLSVLHALRQREDELRLGVEERLASITYLMSHTYAKAFTTPLRNSLTLLRRNLPDGANRHAADAEITRMSLVTASLEATFQALDPVTASASGDYPAPKFRFDEIRGELEEYFRLFLARRVRSLLRDSAITDQERATLAEITLEQWVCFGFKTEEYFFIGGHRQLVLLHLTNFIDNAVRNMDLRRASQGISDGLIEVRAYTEGKDGVISISDNGRGIPQTMVDRLTKVFETAAHRGIALGAADMRAMLSQRFYTDGGGGRRGMAMILAAEYFGKLCDVTGRTRGSIVVARRDGGGTEVQVRIPSPARWISVNEVTDAVSLE